MGEWSTIEPGQQYVGLPVVTIELRFAYGACTISPLGEWKGRVLRGRGCFSMPFPRRIDSYRSFRARHPSTRKHFLMRVAPGAGSLFVFDQMKLGQGLHALRTVRNVRQEVATARRLSCISFCRDPTRSLADIVVKFDQKPCSLECVTSTQGDVVFLT